VARYKTAQRFSDPGLLVPSSNAPNSPDSSDGQSCVADEDITDPYRWTGSTAPWRAIQENIRSQVRFETMPQLPRYVLGVDCAFSRDGRRIKAAAVVWDVIDRAVIEQQLIIRPCNTPYVPTYLTFREAPAVLEVINRINEKCALHYGAILFDGQGLAHPRRCGIATHLGVLLDRPSVGCAKSRLCGTHDEPAAAHGSTSPLIDSGEVVGQVLRTRANVKPLFISIGHRMDLPTAVRLVMACTTRFRLPEPTRLADKLSKFTAAEKA